MCKLLLIGPVGATCASCAHVFWLISRLQRGCNKIRGKLYCKKQESKKFLLFLLWPIFATWWKKKIFKKYIVLSKSSFSSKKKEFQNQNQNLFLPIFLFLQKKIKIKIYSFQYSFFFKNSKKISFEFSFFVLKKSKDNFSNNPSL